MKYIILLLSALFLVVGCGGNKGNKGGPDDGGVVAAVPEEEDQTTEKVAKSYAEKCQTVPGRYENWEQRYRDRYRYEGGKGEGVSSHYKEFFDAVVNGTVSDVEEVVEKNNVVVKDVSDQYGRNPLHWVVFYFGHLSSEHPDLVEYFVENGVDVNAQDECGNTPLHYIAEYKSDLTFAKDSLDYWNTEDTGFWWNTGTAIGTAFTSLLFDAQESIAEQFLDADGDVTVVNNAGLTPYDVANRSGREWDVSGAQDDVYDEFYSAYERDNEGNDDEDEDEDEDEE